MRFLFFLLSLLSSYLSFSQEGQKIPLRKFRVAFLDNKLRETSGLLMYQEKLYSINDGGNSAEIIELESKTGKILHFISVAFPNQDWEAIYLHENKFFIGDFGNNLGTRKDFQIYSFSLSKENILSNPSVLTFTYPNQKDFTPRNRNHNYDMEAMVYYEDKLHLFSKEWQSKTTTHYTINPELKDVQIAQLIETINIPFLVTDACVFKEELYLIGYSKKGKVCLWIFPKKEKNSVWNTTPRKFRFGSVTTIGQVEGLTVNEKGIYISSEKFPFFASKPALYFIAHSLLGTTK